MDRRELFHWLSSAAGMAGLSGLAPMELGGLGEWAHRHPPSTPFRTLDPHAAGTVTVAAELILPRTETPGATDAGVTAFIDRMLDGWYSAEERDRFLAGLADLDARSRRRGGRDYVGLGAPDQLAEITALDAELTAFRSAPPRGQPTPWFGTLKYLTIYGFCTSKVGASSGLGVGPRPWRYEPCAPFPAPRRP